MKKEKLFKISFVVFIVLILCFLYLFKNDLLSTTDVAEDNTDSYNSMDLNESDITDSIEDVVEIDLELFKLEVDEIDLEYWKTLGMPIIIDFGSDSCVPCQTMYPYLVSVNEKAQGLALVKFIDVWENERAANGFPIILIPTQIFINSDGTPYIPSDDIDIEFISYESPYTGELLFTLHQGILTEEEILLILSDMGVDIIDDGGEIDG